MCSPRPGRACGSDDRRIVNRADADGRPHAHRPPENPCLGSKAAEIVMEAGVVHPTLDTIAADPMKAAYLTATERAALLGQCAGFIAALTAPMVASAAGEPATADSSLHVLTTNALAELWGMPEAKIRELCRTGFLPAKKLGRKEWVVSVDALREWLPRPSQIRNDSFTLSLPRDPGRGPQAPSAARPFTVEVRHRPRRPQSDGGEVGSRDARHERDDGASVARVGRARNGSHPATATPAHGINSSPEGTLR